MTNQPQQPFQQSNYGQPQQFGQPQFAQQQYGQNPYGPDVQMMPNSQASPQINTGISHHRWFAAGITVLTIVLNFFDWLTLRETSRYYYAHFTWNGWGRWDLRGSDTAISEFAGEPEDAFTILGGMMLGATAIAVILMLVGTVLLFQGARSKAGYVCLLIGTALQALYVIGFIMFGSAVMEEAEVPSSIGGVTFIAWLAFLSALVGTGITIWMMIQHSNNAPAQQGAPFQQFAPAGPVATPYGQQGANQQFPSQQQMPGQQQFPEQQQFPGQPWQQGQ